MEERAFNCLYQVHKHGYPWEVSASSSTQLIHFKFPSIHSKKKKGCKITKANRSGYSQIILLTIKWLHVYPASKPTSYQLNTQSLPTTDWFSDVRKGTSGPIRKIRAEQAEWNKQYFSIWFAIRKRKVGLILTVNWDSESSWTGYHLLISRPFQNITPLWGLLKRG